MPVKTNKPLTEIDGFSVAAYKTVAGNIKTIEKKGKELQTLIHATAVQAMIHAKAYGDVTLATKLVKALPSAARREALKLWFKDFGPFKWQEDKKNGTEGYVMDKGKNRNLFRIVEANEVPFWDYSKEKVENESLSLAALIAIINQNIDKVEKIAKGESKRDHLAESENPDDALAIVRSLRETMLPFAAANLNKESNGEEITETDNEESDELAA